MSSVGAFLDELARVEHADAVAHLRDHAEVVADEQHRGASSLPELRDQVEHLGLDGRVEPGRRLVEDEQLGSVASAIAITTRCCMPPES